MICQICCDETSRKVIPCSACDYSVCRGCCRLLVGGGESSTGKCPQCSRVWGVDELQKRVGVSFWKGAFRRARASFLVLQEGPKLAELMPVAAAVALKREVRKSLSEARADFRRGDMGSLQRISSLRQRLRVLNRQKAVSGAFPCSGCGIPCGLEREGGWEGVEGSVSSGSVSCSSCSLQHCVRCQQPIGEGEHVCDTDILASKRWIERECRPCVHCGAPSQRAEGCSTMWCPKCHTFWNWRSGRTLAPPRGAMPHNPDHRAWVASHRGSRREIGDIPCGGMPHGLSLAVAVERVLEPIPSYSLLHVLVTIENVFESFHTAQGLRVGLQKNPSALQALRVARLVGDIPSDEKYGILLERKERDEMYRYEVDSILETWTHGISYILQRFTIQNTPAVIMANEVLNLRVLIADELITVSNTFSRQVPFLTPQLQWESYV